MGNSDLDRSFREVVCVAGAGGYVGRSIVSRLIAEGYDVVALGRREAALPPQATQRIAVDITDVEATTSALRGARAAYYLVHSMGSDENFALTDRKLAYAFSLAAKSAGVGRIIYVGGLGSGELSKHLASHQEVGLTLASTGVPVVELRAAVVLGAGSISFEMLRYLTERLPVMVCPRWITTKIQPISEGELLDYLVLSLEASPGIYEVGGADVTTYLDMIATYARVRGLRRRLIVRVPLLTPRLSSYWVDIVTPVDHRVSHSLIDSLVSPVVVEDHTPASAQFNVDPLALETSLARALSAQGQEIDKGLFDLSSGLENGVYTLRLESRVVDPERVAEGLIRIGGDLNWYGIPRAWALRIGLGRLLGERLTLRRAPTLKDGSLVDWWTVVRARSDELVLTTRDWRVGEGWLGYRLREDGVLEQVAAFRPRGVIGFLYWKMFRPFHGAAFSAMLRARSNPKIQK